MKPHHLLLILALALCAITFSRNIAAQEPPPPPEPANYAFAAYMGSGLYSATDSSLFVLNMATHFDIQDRDERIRLSASAGFFDYSRDNIEGLELPDHIGTLTIIPGLERIFYVHQDFKVIPHIDYGYAKNFSTKEEAQVYSVGIRSRYTTRGKHDDHLWFNSFLLAGYRTFSSDQEVNYVKLLTGYDYKIPKHFLIGNHKIVPTVYGHASWSYNGIDYFEEWKSNSGNDLNYEVGITLKAPTPIDLWITDMDRLGLGVQHNPFGTVIRLFFGSPFL